MNETLKNRLTEYVGRLKCISCGKEFEFHPTDPEDEVTCYLCHFWRAQTFQREDIEKISISLESSTPKYSVTIPLLVDHKKKNIIPGRMGAIYGNVDSSRVEEDVIEFLRNKGYEITKKDFWKGYTFIEDFSRISGPIELL